MSQKKELRVSNWLLQLHGEKERGGGLKEPKGRRTKELGGDKLR